MSEQDQQNTKPDGDGSSWTERIEVASAEALETIKSLIREGNVRRVTIKNSNGKKLLSLPVTAGAAIGGVAVLAVPTIAAIAAFTALLTHVTLEIERTGAKDDPDSGSSNDSIVSAEVVDDADQ